MQITKGKFSDGEIGWKVGQRNTNGTAGFEIHWSDDGECVTDHVYTEADAHLIASAPNMAYLLKDIMEHYNEHGQLLSFDVNKIREVLKNAVI